MDSASTPGTTPTRRGSRTITVAALVAGLALGGGAAARASTAASTSATSSAAASSADTPSQSAGWTFPRGRGRLVPGGSASGSGAAASTLTAATSAQETGVVDIDVVLGGTERAAGTGMVLTSTGEVLTNRHVVQGETSISVTVAATGRIYAARVVGISTTTDVAVVQLTGASGLATVTPASSAVPVGASVVGVGNAGGTGGTPSAAAGTITGTGQSITASDEDGSNPERLTGLLETDAGIQPGDSGGPLLDASNEVVGMDTAASSQGDDAYAIPIATALAVARQIEAGGSGTQAGAGSSTSTSSSRHPYVGVQVEDGAGGALVAGVVAGSPADAAGLSAGDTITSVAGHPVDSASALARVMTSLTAGHPVSVTWTDQDGTTHSAHVAPVATLR